MQPSHELVALGQFLGQHRRALGVTRSVVARKLHLREAYVQAIEEGDLTSLPGATYAQGYIVRYAYALGFSESSWQAQVAQIQALQAPKEWFAPQVFSPSVLPSHSLLCVCAAACIALLAGFHWAMRIPEITPQAEISSPGNTFDMNASAACLQPKTDDYLACAQKNTPSQAGFSRKNLYFLPGK